MRDYILGYNQAVLIKNDLNLTDVLLLKYLEEYFSSGFADKLKINNQDFYLVYYKKILNDLPILNIGYDMLRKKFKVLEEKGFLKKLKQSFSSTTLYIQLNLNKLDSKSETYQKIEGRDTSLATFIKTNWKLKKNYSCYFLIYQNEFIYEHTYISPHILENDFEDFKRILLINLKMSLNKKIFDIFDQQLKIELINKKIKFSTINYACLKDIFVDNLNKIEASICNAYIEIFKNL